jgi:anhydro-N-acetylmuramic acid kinase
MSGTSLDGVDLCYAIFNGTAFNIVRTQTISYSAEWKKKLVQAPNLSGQDLIRLHGLYGQYLGTLCHQFLSEHHLKADAIASHGHTIFHQPQEQLTYQIGDGAFIAAESGIDCIYDFRKLDIALHGQGAPLVPIGDELLFSEYTYCLNIGGFSNLSKHINGKRLAYDICPSNIVLNELSKHFPLGYDDRGENARKGLVNQDCLDLLNALSFYQVKGAKSLGREWVESEIFPILNQAELSLPDLLATYTEHIAQQIGNELQIPGNCLTTGGGVWNDYLMERIQTYSKTALIRPEPKLIDFKEALIFAYLGYLFLEEKVNTLSSVTGSVCDSIGGILCKAPRINCS